MITKRKMIADLRKNGFSKSQLQMSRGGHSYSKKKEAGGRYIMITVPKHSRHLVIVTGSSEHDGYWFQKANAIGNLKTPVIPEGHDAYSWAVELSGVAT